MDQIDSPQGCGLPQKFTSWRPNQEKAIDVMITSPKRVIAISAPTGFGKSPAYVAAALLSKKPTIIVTNSKGLQDQLMTDFADCGLVDIRGKSNYQCHLRDDYSCQEGHAAKCPYKGSVNCPYSKAELKAMSSPLIVTNYDKWINSSKYGVCTWTGHIQQVILDEGHHAPDAVAEAVQQVISYDDIEKILHMPYPQSVEHVLNWKIWAAYARQKAEECVKMQQSLIDTVVGAPKATWIKQLLHLKNLVRKLIMLAICRPSNWTVEEVEGGFQFDCIRPAQYAEGTLLLHMPRIVVVSATLRPKTLHMLGLTQEHFQFVEFDSDFDKSRCPIYWIPTMRVDARAGDLSLLWIRLDQIASRRRDRKGIVHTISYQRRDEVVKASRFKDSILTNQKGEHLGQLITTFRSAGPGKIMVSPSVSTGYDFPGKDCEWQFLCKIPFPDGRSKIMQARQEADKEYGPYLAMQTMVQTFGRGMRSREDQCVSSDTLILRGDLVWVPASSIQIGTRLLAFSEHGGGFNRLNRTNPRLWQWSTVQAVAHTFDELFEVEYDDGKTICTIDHGWLVSHQTHRTAEWRQTKDLKEGTKLIRYLKPWSIPNTYDQGWLAGFLDGEGCLQLGSGKRNPNVMGLFLAQNAGLSLSRAESILSILQFKYNFQNRDKACKLLRLNGGLSEIIRLLGSVRPERLLHKYMQSTRKERALAIAYPRVLSIRSIGIGKIVVMRTSTKTYIADGMGCHNCENFIPDDHLSWFLPRYRHLAPRTFHNFFRRVDSLPAPPTPLG